MLRAERSSAARDLLRAKAIEAAEARRERVERYMREAEAGAQEVVLHRHLDWYLRHPHDPYPG